jgi:cell division protein FtsI (penicillin-binding protein 3)
MFSLYSGIPADDVLRAISSRKGNVQLAKELNFQQYQGLQKLSRELTNSRLMVGHHVNGQYRYIGLSVSESGAERIYPYGDTLTPFIGYTNEYHEGRYSRVNGIKGIEKRFNDDIKPLNDGFVRGNRDVRGVMILNGTREEVERSDGSDVHLNIYMSLQKRIELMLSQKQEELKAKEIIASIMESETGNVIALATSNRFVRRTLRDMSYLNIHATEYVFEPGSVIKPIVYGIMLDEKKIRKGQMVDCENGRYRVGRKLITDEHIMKLVPVEDIIIHSSNIGMAKLVKDFDAISFYNGLTRFGFGENSGLEVSREVVGEINTVQQLNSHIYRATSSYGYGMMVNFMQLMKAYNVFNNDGKIVIPKGVAYLKSGDNIFHDIMRESATVDNSEVVSTSTARKIKNILVRTVKEGTGKDAEILGLEIGGKTGTAHIAQRGGYVDKYHSSFFGFANDREKKYTIGVTVVDPKESYFASKTAVPIFKNVVEIMLENKFLKKYY